MNQPLRFASFLRPMVWGGRRLESVLGKQLPTGEPYGEAWEISDHPIHRSVVAAGKMAGKSLRQLVEQDREAILGPAARDHAIFPWLIKFLDCNDWLSVQVHPNEDAARQLGVADGSKTEAWFVLDAAPGSRVYAGLKPGTDEKAIREALRNDTLLDCLHQFEPRAGDCLFLPAGAVHALGGGILLAEVQQTSDVTFRLYDWGRPRPLHVEQAMACIDWHRGPLVPIRVEHFHDRSVTSTSQTTEPLVRSPYFHLDYHHMGNPTPVGGEGRVQALVVLGGQGRLVGADCDEAVSSGQAWLLPASMSAFECRPEIPLKALLCRLP